MANLPTRLVAGATTIWLSNDAAYHIVGCEWRPEPGRGTDETTEDPIRLILEGTAAELDATLESVRGLLSYGESLYEAHAEDAVYIEVQAPGGVAWYRSRVVGGSAPLSGEIMRRQMVNAADTMIEVEITVKRLDWFETADVVTAPVSPSSLRNGDASPYNAGTIATVAGDLPAPARVEITNTDGNTPWTDVWIANDVNHGFAGAEQFVDNSTAASWIEEVGHTIVQVKAPISAAVLAKCKGAGFKILCGFSAVSGTAFYVRATIYAEIGGVVKPLYVGGEIYNNGYKLLDMGTFPVPPTGRSASTSVVGIMLTVRSALAGSFTMDFFHLQPAFALRRLRQVGFTAVSGAVLVDDGMEGDAYLESSGQQYPIVETFGDPLMLYPGRANRISVLYRESTAFNKGTFTLGVKYRPRRRVI